MDAATPLPTDAVFAGLGSPPRAGDQAAQSEILRYFDYRDFLAYLGVDPRVDASGIVMVAAHHMFASPMPPGWSEQVEDASSRLYFFNRMTGESAWLHPQDALFRELIDEVRSWRPDEPLDEIVARSDAQLRRAHDRASEAILQWSGPYMMPQLPEECTPESGAAAQFYFNSDTQESRWADPRQPVEFDLRQRYSILCECIAAHAQTLAKMHDLSSSEGEDETPPRLQLIVKNLWDSIGTLPLPVRKADAPDVAPQDTTSEPRLPSESARSYLTARSTMSCNEDGQGEGATPFLLQPPAL